jgi:hypothetical protein
VFEVGNHGGELDVEPFVENVSIQIRPFAFVFAPVSQFGSKNIFKTRFDFVPYFVGSLARANEVGIGIGLDIFKCQAIKDDCRAGILASSKMDRGG